MKLRTPAFRITPVHRDGQTASSIYVNAMKYEEALKVAASKCTLMRFNKQDEFGFYSPLWTLI